jgi:DUF2075 family protein
MLYTVKDFCNNVERDLNGFMHEIESSTYRMMHDQELRELAQSYSCVSRMLTISMRKKPSIAEAYISTTNLLLEYKLPAASSWCDLVLLGKRMGQQHVVIIELKNWLKNNSDQPGIAEGLIMHNGKMRSHPSDQVKGYTEYCRHFHNVIAEEKAQVDGCVYFTQNIELMPYASKPNEQLVKEYPIFNLDSTDGLADYVNERIDVGDFEFAERFVNGYYNQDRNILEQVTRSLRKYRNNETDKTSPFVLLDEQRLGFKWTMDILSKRIKDGKKEVIIIEGPPGSGKSAIAINLWVEAASQYGDLGNIVYVTTSSAQNDNWSSRFNNFGGFRKADGFIIKANEFNPGMTGTTMRDKYYGLLTEINPKYAANEKSLKYEYFRDYVKYMIEHNYTKPGYRKHIHFLSIVDEAHALINPLRKNFSATQKAGWCLQMGPQAYHIIFESQVSVFLTDGKQSFRDNETTSKEDIKEWAHELGANVTEISLEGMQFRCAGSVEYVDWIEHIFSNNPIRNHNKWREKFKFEVFDSPWSMERNLRAFFQNGDKSVRIISSYSREWQSRDILNKNHYHIFGNYDFDIKDNYGREFKKYWNNPENYEIFIQAPQGSMMAQDPLCEVGCPYVVRGFEYDYVGILWLEDLVRRGDKWVIDLQYACETATKSSRKKAVDEQIEINKKLPKYLQRKHKEIEKGQIVVQADGSTPMAYAYFETIVQAYRILLTRAVKGVYLYIKDDETREYIKTLLA